MGDAGVAVKSFDAADSGSKHVNRADAMRGWLTAVLGRGPLQGAITGVDAGNIMRSFVGRVVDMAEQGEACLTNRRDRSTNASMWRIEWKRRTARWQIEKSCCSVPTRSGRRFARQSKRLVSIFCLWTPRQRESSPLPWKV